jgi:hypothetical protein
VHHRNSTVYDGKSLILGSILCFVSTQPANTQSARQHLFQQDRATLLPNFTYSVKVFSNETFPEWWIGQAGPMTWAAFYPRGFLFQLMIMNDARYVKVYE